MPLIYIFLMVMSQGFTYAFIWFIAEWKSHAFNIEAYDYVAFYGGIALTALILLILTSAVFIRLFRKISFRLFLIIVRSLVYKDMTWFKENAASKIINVFVTDYNEVDQLMGLSVNAFLQNFIRLNVGLVIILYKTYFMAPTLILVHLTLLVVLKSFLKTDRSLK